jgi:Holliday junction resolvase RusA-like endonuclease
MEDYDDRLNVCFIVAGEPVPWSAPVRGRWGGSQPNKRLVVWQAEIAKVAREAFGPKLPWTGPVALQALFSISRNMPKGVKAADAYACPELCWDEAQSKHRLKSKCADLTNLIKAAEDALQSIVYVDDAQVVVHWSCGSFWNKKPGVYLSITRK